MSDRNTDSDGGRKEQKEDEVSDSHESEGFIEPDRGFDGPWLQILAVAVVGWVVLFAVHRFLLDPATPAGAGVEFVYAYLLAPLSTAAILLDALSLRDDGVVDLGLFKWLYALVALVYPVVAVVYYAHREWLMPGEPGLLEEPTP